MKIQDINPDMDLYAEVLSRKDSPVWDADDGF